MDSKEQARMLFEAYNRYMEGLGESFLSRVTASSDIYTEEFEEEFNSIAGAESDEFFTKPLAGLPAGTPAEFIRSLGSLDDCMDVFVIASEVSDVQPPRVLLEQLRGFGEEAVVRLRALALAERWDRSEDSEDFGIRDRMAPNLSAVLTLGQWNDKGSMRPILKHFSQASTPDEYVADVIAEYAESMGDAITEELRHILDGAETIRAGGPEESILIALAKAGSKHRTEETYQSLRAAFRKAERKIIGALCLGDYGDERAVSLLKNYLDRNNQRVDREFFYEALTIIRKLGGDISDINDPFGDFGRK